MSVNPIKGKFVKLSNDEALKASNAAASAEVEILKVNASDEIVLLDLPIVDDGVNPASNVSTEAYVDGEISTVNGRIDDHVDGTAEKHGADDIVVVPAGNLAATNVQSALEEIQGDASQALSDAATAQGAAAAAQSDIDNHIGAISGAHAASAISVTPTGNLGSSSAQAAFEELQGDIDGINTTIGGLSFAAQDISFVPAGDIVATNVQDAIEELDSEKVAKSGGDTMSGTYTVDGTFVLPTTGVRTASISSNGISTVSSDTNYAAEYTLDGVSINALDPSVTSALTTIYPGQMVVNFSDEVLGEAYATKIENGVLSLTFSDGLVTDAPATPTLSKHATTKKYVDDGLALKLNLAGGDMSGDINMQNTSTIKNLAAPLDAQDAATKQYVDNIAEGLHVHAPARLLANVDLGGTYNNGSSGVGAHIDFSPGISSIDGVTSFNVGDRIILAKQNGNSLDTRNGVYYIEDAADLVAGEIVKLTRAQDFDTPTEMAGGDFVFVQEGSQYADSGWVMSETVVTVGTTPVQFLQFSGAGSYAAGDALSLTGNEFDVKFDSSSINTNMSNQLQVKDGGIIESKLGFGSVTSDKISMNAVTASKLNSDVAGAGLILGSSNELKVKADEASIEVDEFADLIKVKDGGIIESKLGFGSVTSDKIGLNAVTASKLNSDVAGAGLILGSSNELKIKADEASIEVDIFADLIKVKDGGIIESKLGFGSVTADKISMNAVTASKLNSDVAGAGLILGSSNELKIKADEASIEVDIFADLIKVKDGGIIESKLGFGSVTADKIGLNAVTASKLNSDVAGAGLILGSSNELKIKADEASIEVDIFADLIKVKDGGIIESKLGFGSVTSDKIGLNAVTASKLNSDVAGDGLSLGSSNELKINAGNGIQISSDAVAVKLDGSSLSVSIDGLKSNIVWHKESYPVTSTLTSGAFFDLGHVAEVDSISAFVDRLAIHEGASEDYSVDYTGGTGGKTRIYFLNALVLPGQQQLSNGDTIFFKYQRKSA